MIIDVKGFKGKTNILKVRRISDEISAEIYF
jgi:hypothetical protein